MPYHQYPHSQLPSSVFSLTTAIAQSTLSVSLSQPTCGSATRAGTPLVTYSKSSKRERERERELLKIRQHCEGHGDDDAKRRRRTTRGTENTSDTTYTRKRERQRRRWIRSFASGRNCSAARKEERGEKESGRALGGVTSTVVGSFC